MEATLHAQERFKERRGLPKKALDKVAETAHKYGVERLEATGRLRRYMDYVTKFHNYAGEVRAFGEYMYVFSSSNGNLITVYDLPNAYRKSVNKAVKRKRESDSGE